MDPAHAAGGALETVASNGILGAILVISWLGLVWWIVRLQRTLDDAQQKRVEDAKGTSDRVLKVAEANMGTQQATAQALNQQAMALQEIQGLVESLREDQKDLRDEVRDLRSRKGGAR